MRIVCKPNSMAGSAVEGEVSVVISDEITSHLDRLDLKIRGDYYDSFNRSNVMIYKVSAEQYLFGNDRRWLDRSLLCPEMPVPGNLSRIIRLSMPHSSTSTDQAVALVHAGRKECMTPIHFDWDHKWIAHACLIGRKRFFLFPPNAGWLLSPIINTSALAIPKFSESDRSDLFQSLGGREIILEAGQGILFPSMFWHGALYEEPSLALSVRYEMNVRGRPFGAIPRSWFLQRLVWRFFKNAYDSEAINFLVQYLKSFFSRTRTWKDRYKKVTELSRSALLECGEQRGVQEWVGENFSLEMALASEELKIYYGKVAARTPYDKDRITETQKYLFQGVKDVSVAHQLLLSRYALSVRQGLPPKRGLVQIEQE